MKKCNLKNSKIELMPIQEKHIIKSELVSFLNNPDVNKFLSTKKKIQTFSSVKKYLKIINKEGNLYYGIFDVSNKKLFGTLTLRKKNKFTCYLGYMIGDTKYWGGQKNIEAFNVFVNYVFEELNFKKILAGASIDNIASNFFLLKQGFQIFKKTKKGYFYKFIKKNFKNNYKYESSEIS
jgi:RimJ/RimL family protein N-acetyltransferase